MRRPIGRVQPGSDALRADRAAAGVRGGRPAQPDAAGAARGAGAAQEAGAGCPAQPGDDRGQGDGPRPRIAVRDGRGPGRRPAPFHRGQADPRAAGLAGRAAGAVVPAEPVDRGVDGCRGPGAGGRGRDGPASCTTTIRCQQAHYPAGRRSGQTRHGTRVVPGRIEEPAGPARP